MYRKGDRKHTPALDAVTEDSALGNIRKESEDRRDPSPDRRAVQRGGRRTSDRPGRYPSLLVADSYDSARVPCVRYLDKFGFHVEQAADGNEALARIEATRPHVILVEDGLPNVSAWRLVQRLQEQPETRSIPVIVMTSDFELTRKQPEASPAAAILVKPFALSTMLSEIRRVLRAHPPAPTPLPRP